MNVTPFEASDIMEGYEQCVGDVTDAGSDGIIMSYLGKFESAAQFGEYYADMLGLFDGMEDTHAYYRYFNFSKYATDLLNESYAMSDDGRVYSTY
jgi:antirestriction protein